MTFTREEVLAAATEIHDEQYGSHHCDRKYLRSCHRLAQAILDAGTRLRAQKGETPMTESDDTFAEWVILELMGHRRLAGYLREVEIAGQGFLRLDVPTTGAEGSRPPTTQLYRPAAVYCITPTTEDVARRVAASAWAPPISRLELTAPRTDADNSAMPTAAELIDRAGEDVGAF